MKLPDEALLEFEITGKDRVSILTQTARFKPRGFAGLPYRATVLPIHRFLFRCLLEGNRWAVESLPATDVVQGAPIETTAGQ